MSGIEIKTAQHVVIEYELASPGIRILAYFIDLLAWLVVLAAMSYLIFAWININSNTFETIYFIIFFLLYLCYDPYCEIFYGGQTLGKKLTGIRVIKLDSERSDFLSFGIRAVFRVVDVTFSLGSLAFLFIISSNQKQRLGDILAHTAVVKSGSKIPLRLADLERIESAEIYKPMYPEVKKLRDEDIILVRNVLERYRKHPNNASFIAMSELVKKLSELLQIDTGKISYEDFLKRLIKDYIVLTR